MKSFQFSTQKFFYVIATAFLVVACLIYSRPFIVPFGFSLLISFILMPSVKWLERKRIPSAIAIIIVFILVVGLIFGITYFFSSQISKLVSDFQSFTDNFYSILDQGIKKYNESVTFLPPVDDDIIKKEIIGFVQSSGGSILSTTFAQTSSFVAAVFLIPVYVFLFLFYRKGIKKGITYFFPEEKHQTVEEILYEVQGVGKNYIVGLLTVMLILAILNSTFLLIVGIDYAIMFGCLAALLIIIPYIGTYLGSALPILYALITMDVTSAIIILIGFVIIQALEGNFLTPKIVGGNTNVNALTAFTALIAGGYIWGISGMVLAIPFVAMLNKIFRYINGLQPVALLLGETLYEEDITFPELKESFNSKRNNENNFEEFSTKAKKVWKIWFGKEKKKDEDLDT